MYRVSRYGWRERGNADPGDRTVSPRCLNKLCVRHLYTRTRTEIMASVPRVQMAGEHSHLARLSTKQVLLIRKLYAKGNITQAALAKRFTVSLGQVKTILSRRSWKHV
jgi:DNA-binding MarR family transcriptional regulator